MKITKSKIRQIIKEEITDHWDKRDKIAMSGALHDEEELSDGAYTPQKISRALEQKSVRGPSFYRLVKAAMEEGEHKKAASYIMDALFIDDVWEEDEVSLVDALAKNSSQNINNMRLVPQIASDWVNGLQNN